MEKKGRLVLVSLMAMVLIFCSVADASRGIMRRPVSPAGAEVKGDQWLFVMGVDTYIHWPRLKTAVNDAKAFRDVLLSLYHFDKRHLIELYDEDATRKNIIAKFRYLARSLNDHDSLVVFYAGHGHLDSITKQGSWVPVESGVKDASAWISNHDIKNYLKIDAIKAKHILLISDSCFSGDFFRGHRGKLPEVTDEVIKKSYELSSRQAIASGGLEPVSDAGFGHHSVFSYFLLKTLQNNGKPFFIPSDFFPAVKAGVAENAEQFPRFGSLTGTGGQQGGELVFFLKQDSRLEALSAVSIEREKELERLSAMEAAAGEAQRKEAAEIARREKELAKMDARINDMKHRLGTASQKGDDSLETMLAMVRQKEEQQGRLEALKKKREAEEAKRRAQIERLKREKRDRVVAAAKEDIKTYKEIVSSPFGKDMKEAAWKSLAAKYPEAAKGLEIGDAERLLLRARYGDVEPTFRNSTGMKFVYIEPCTFMMGSPSDEPERNDDEKQHRVTLTKGFYMQTTEVTQGQWKAVMGDNPSYFNNCGDDCPVEHVSWRHVQKFIKKLNRKKGGNRYRLPTEAEWEYACRAGTETPFSFGRCLSTEQANYNGNHPLTGCSEGRYRKKPVTVASFPPNAWGLYDMHGNVWEWCQDRKGNYPSGSVTDPTGPWFGLYRVLRGGSWHDSARFCRSADRYGYSPGDRYGSGGFRLAFSPGQ